MKYIITESQHRFLTLQSWVEQLNKIIDNFDNIDCDGEDYFKYKLFCQQLPQATQRELTTLRDKFEEELSMLVNQEFQRVYSKK